MAKISTYPIISIPTIDDLLIGTDVNDLNNTKNFTIGDIGNLIGQDYVPYVGATGNVNLGSFNITGGGFIVGGGTASQFLKADGSLDSTLYTPQTRTLTINGTTYNLSANRSWDLNTIDSLTTTGTSGAATYIGKVLNIPVYQAQGSYITQLSGEATGSGPGNASVTLSNAAVISKVLTGLNVTGGTVVSTDTILQAFGKVQNQINGLTTGVTYQGVWNAATNVPFLQSSVGTQGYYYVVDVAGTTNLNGITDWQVGDWAIYNGTAWQKVDNTDAVVSVNGYVGAVVLTASDVGAVPTTRTLTINGVGYNLSADRAWTVGDVRTDGSYANPSWITSLGWSKITGTPTTLAGYGITDGALNTTTLTINGTTFDLTANRTWNVGTVTSVGTSGPLTGGTITGSGTIGITQAGASSDGYLSSTDWNTFNSKQGAISVNAPLTFVSGVIGITQAGASSDGYLSSTDWNTFNSKVSGSGTANTLPMWGSSSSLINSPLSYAADTFNFQYNSATGGTVNFTNSNGVAYAYTIQMNNFGSPRSTIHSYTDGLIIQSIGGTQVSRMFANGNLILGTGTVDNGYKLEVTGDLYLSSIVNATVDTDRFIVSDGGLIKYRTGAQILTDIGAVSSVGLTMPPAFTVSNTPITSSGTIAVTAAGNATQYIRGDGSLADFPGGGGGGGASVSYYLNGSVNQGTFGGNTYYEMSKTPILGAGTDFSVSADGYISQFITDAGDPNLLEIPAGNWNFETYFSASSGGGTPTFYVELYKYDGTTFTLIASNSSSPELIAFGTTINPYFSALAVPQTPLLATDRLAIRIYVNTSGRTITLHTEDNHLCQVITTFTTGLTALNGLTAQVQYFQTGTSGTDFNILSSVATHTFNLPTASAANRGALSSADWTTFNNKQNALTLTTTGTSGVATLIGSTLNIPDYGSALSGYVPTSRTLTINGTTFDLSANRTWSVGTVTSVAALTLGTSGTDLSSTVANGTTTPVITLNVPTASATNRGALSSSDWTMFNNKQSQLNGTGFVKASGTSITYDNSTYVTINTNESISGFKTFTNSIALSNSISNGFNFEIGSTGSFTSLKAKTSGGSNIVTLPSSNGTIALTSDLSGYIQGSGTTNYLPKFTGSTTIGDSLLVDNGVSLFYGANIITLGNSNTSEKYLELSSSTGAFYFGGTSAEHYIFGSGSKPISFYTNGTLKATLTSGGNLLVGTTTDNGARLQVSGTATVSGNGLFGGATALTGLNGGISVNGASNSGINFRTSDVLRGYVYTTSGNMWVETVSGSVILAPNGSPALTLASTGAATFSSSVTVQSGNSLFVNNAANTRSGFLRTSGDGTELSSFAGAGEPLILIAPDTNATIRFYTGGATGANERMRITAGGNVGIGTSSPNGKLRIQNDNSTIPSLIVRDGGTPTANLIEATSNAYGSSFIVTAIGNVGIGTASPVARLDTISAETGTYGTSTQQVVARFYNLPSSLGSGNNSAFLSLQTSADGGNANPVARIGVVGESYGSNNGAFVVATRDGGGVTERMRITSSGNLLVGTTTDNGARLQVSGTATFSSSVTAGAFLTNGSSGTAGQEAIRINNDNGYIGFFNSANNTRSGYIQGNTTDLTIATSPSNPLIFATANVERMRITSGGNVLVANASASSSGLISIAVGNSIGGAVVVSDTDGGGTLEMQAAGGLTYLTTTTNHALTIGTNNTERMRITSSGNVGIGTGSPDSFNAAADNLVVGTTSGNNGITIAAATNGFSSIYFADGTTGNEAFRGYFEYGHSADYLAFGTAASERMRITSGGNVGIGTASISNPISFIRVLNISGGDAGLIFSNTNGTAKNWSIGAIDSGSFVFFDGASERMRITSGGNVGIGTSSPSNKLQIASGNIGLDDSWSINFGSGSTFINGTSASNILRFITSSTERMQITSGGNVLIGTTTDVGARLYVDGAFRTGTLTAGTQTAAVDWRLGNARGGTATANALVRVQINGVLVDLIGNYV